MNRQLYLAPWAIAQARPAGNAGGCMALTAQPLGTDMAVCDLVWDFDWRAREAWEAQAGVIPLGNPWELLPAAAVPVLESLRQSLTAIRAENVTVTVKAASPQLDYTVAIDATHTVAQAVRKALPQFVGFI